VYHSIGRLLSGTSEPLPKGIVPQDFVKALAWLNLSASRGDGADQKKSTDARDVSVRSAPSGHSFHVLPWLYSDDAHQ
jgi:hypothetical protein